MRVSVVILAYNEEKTIGKCLESLKNQEVKPDEIIIVDNNCTDNTVKVASKYPVRIIKEEKQGIIHARNKGFDEVKYDIIARCDADTIPTKHWIKTIKEDFENNDIIAATSTLYWYDAKFPKLTSIFMNIMCFYLVSFCIGSPVLIGSNMLITKDVWDRLKNKLCTDHTKVHEDADMTIHMKGMGKILFDKRLCILTSNRRWKGNTSSAFYEYPLRFIKMMLFHKSQ